MLSSLVRTDINKALWKAFVERSYHSNDEKAASSKKNVFSSRLEVKYQTPSYDQND